jgi:hypothetical protein
MNSCSIQCSHIVLVAAQVTVLELANMLTLSRQQEYSLDSIMDTTGRSRRELREIAAQKTPPPKAVLDYFRLTADGTEYVWDPALEYKSNPCWGPVLSKPSDETLDNGRAIRLALWTVESSFTQTFFGKSPISL